MTVVPVVCVALLVAVLVSAVCHLSDFIDKHVIFNHVMWFEQDPIGCSSVQVEHQSKNKCAKYLYDLTPLYHDPQYSDSLYFMGESGDLTYINMCGDTTTACSPSSPVCWRSGLWSTTGFGKLDTQKFFPIGLSSRMHAYF